MRCFCGIGAMDRRRSKESFRVPGAWSVRANAIDRGLLGGVPAGPRHVRESRRSPGDCGSACPSPKGQVGDLETVPASRVLVCTPHHSRRANTCREHLCTRLLRWSRRPGGHLGRHQSTPLARPPREHVSSARDTADWQSRTVSERGRADAHLRADAGRSEQLCCRASVTRSDGIRRSGIARWPQCY